MKKSILTLIAVTSVTSVYADGMLSTNHQMNTNTNTPRLFVEGGLGVTSLTVKNKDDMKLKRKSLFEQNLGLGVDVNDKDLFVFKMTNLNGYRAKYNKNSDIDLKIINFDVDYKHLFLSGHTLRPYINGSVGLTRGKTKILVNNKVTDKKTTTRLSTGFGAGVQANLTNNFVMGVGAEYKYYASDVSGIKGKAFARYYF
ncbi:hypothetical protein A6A19_07890 [Actinobacillus delphinicola]|uniref:Lipid A 3-O-deacylase (PagL) n=1 Tax=Actinobacillus delphinicola TaxID=51161 RepID=A0A448TTS4_9PAST|nr:outer membrane beta-barrel protein [Actinobacillus delphinicola]MDG6897894.1 hypothetical protein [Actinobacillus delphinicola]VEJ09409.1 Lipid A 3-O-deacylase (PagL) [Actinobacillus delphinicola]